MKITKEKTEDILNIMVILTHPDAVTTSIWLRKQLKKLPPHAFHALHGIAGAATRLMFDKSLSYNHDEKTSMFNYLQDCMLEVITGCTDAGTDKNPMHCGLWASPVCKKCLAEGKAKEYCPIDVYGETLAEWSEEQRVAKKEGRLTDEQISQLDSIGFAWEVPVKVA